MLAIYYAELLQVTISNTYQLKCQSTKLYGQQSVINTVRCEQLKQHQTDIQPAAASYEEFRDKFLLRPLWFVPWARVVQSGALEARRCPSQNLTKGTPHKGRRRTPFPAQTPFCSIDVTMQSRLQPRAKFKLFEFIFHMVCRPISKQYLTRAFSTEIRKSDNQFSNTLYYCMWRPNKAKHIARIQWS